MDTLGRIILRLVAIPLGFVLAVVAAVAVLIFSGLELGTLFADDNPDNRTLAALVLGFGSSIGAVLAVGLAGLPALIVILIAETFRIRSFAAYAAAGGLIAFGLWRLLGIDNASGLHIDEPLPAVAAGFAGGLVYWLVAGCWAGFTGDPAPGREGPPVRPAPPAA